MPKIKCALCSRNLKDGEWKAIELEGVQQKVCMNKYRCDQRRRSQKQDKRQRYEVSQELKDIEEHGVKSVMPVKVSSPKRRRMELVAATAALAASIAAFCFIASS